MPDFQQRDDLATAAAAGLLAMCVVTFDHEALGHGGACLALGGRIALLSSSLFQCDPQSGLAAGAGPVSNLITGGSALIVFALLPRRASLAKLFCLLTGVFAWFWDGGYIVQAVATSNGDAYFALRNAFKLSGSMVSAATIVVGLLIYALAMRIAARGLLSLRPDAGAARRIARAAWAAATFGAITAALAFRGDRPEGVLHAATQTALASVPLLFLPLQRHEGAGPAPSLPIARHPVFIAFSLLVFAIFAAVLGRGVGASLAGL